jgi:hypothetical protein
MSSLKNRAVSNDTKKDDFWKEETNQGDVIPKPSYTNDSVVSTSDKKNNNNLQEEGKIEDEDLSNGSTSDNESQDDDAYGSDDFDINDYANDEIKDKKDAGGLLHVPDDINKKLLPGPLQQLKTKAMLEKEAKEKVCQRKRGKKSGSATVDITHYYIKTTSGKIQGWKRTGLAERTSNTRRTGKKKKRQSHIISVC